MSVATVTVTDGQTACLSNVTVGMMYKCINKGYNTGELKHGYFCGKDEAKISYNFHKS